MTAADPRVCCAACIDYDDDIEVCRYQFCECHDWSVSMDAKP